ncbi:MAG: hypothetical protein ABW000_14390 [Actinoplanes sp.]
MTRIAVALFNYEAGGSAGPHGGYRFEPLQQAFADLDETPALILFCEAKRYRDNGNAGLHAAAEALCDELGVPYVGVLGSTDRGPIPPAIFYNPNVLTLRRWCNPDDPAVFDDQRNVARFAINDSGPVRETRREFLAFVAHFHPCSGVVRRQEAELLARYGRETLPVVGGGDLNSTASGPHLPQRDWHAADYPSRAEKGVLRVGVWGPDTNAVDHLIGRWDDNVQGRVDGCGFHAVAELARQANPTMVLLPTVNDGVDAGGGLLIDWLLVNDAMRPHIDTGSYRVHLPDPGRRFPSDHRLVTFSLDL